MSSLRKHKNNKTFDVCTFDEDSLSVTSTTRVTACTAREALKGFLAFRATPPIRPLAIPVPWGPALFTVDKV